MYNLASSIQTPIFNSNKLHYLVLFCVRICFCPVLVSSYTAWLYNLPPIYWVGRKIHTEFNRTNSTHFINFYTTPLHYGHGSVIRPFLEMKWQCHLLIEVCLCVCVCVCVCMHITLCFVCCSIKLLTIKPLGNINMPQDQANQPQWDTKFRRTT